MDMLSLERNLYRVAIVLCFFGILFAFMKDAPFYALIDAGMGVWFTYCLLTTPKAR